MDPIRVLVVDDEEAVVDVLRSLISSDVSLELVGVAHDAERAIAVATEEQPDVVLMDVRMPGGGGIRAVREIVRRNPDIRVVALSAHEDDDTRIRMIGAGARDYIPKSESTSLILDAIHRSMSPRGGRGRRRRLSARSPQDRHEEQRTRVEQALQNGSVTVMFQPVVDLERGDIVGVEAQPRVAMLPSRPYDAWVGDAEAVGLATKLEIAALRSALEPLAAIPEDVFIELEVTPVTASSMRFQRAIRDDWASRFVLTISELSAPRARLSASLDALRERGVRLCLADVGAGMLGLDHAAALWPEFVRLDRAISDGVHVDHARHAIAAVVAGWASKAGSSVIAEGVTSYGQLAELGKVGVQLAQGDRLCPPKGLGELASTGFSALSTGSIDGLDRGADGAARDSAHAEGAP
jgi:DNA-binding NarL/FixJ family response regulator